ncbi:MAG: acetylglutamate kinase [Kofleriaceae bacterium]
MDITTTQDVIVKLLTNLGSRGEVDQYLRYYSTPEQQFAIIRVSGHVLDASFSSLVSSLAFLHRVGLRPIIVLGTRPQVRRALAEAGIDTQVIDGLRVTTPEVLEIALRVFEAESIRLAEALETLGTRARPISGGVFRAALHPDPRLGLVGEVTDVVLTSINSAVRMTQLPILAPFGESATGQILRLDADTLAPALARSIKPHKVIFLTAAGGLQDRDGRIISAINLEEDLDSGIRESLVDDASRDRLASITEMLRALPRSSSVSITSPEHLARELFTHRGAGTLVRLGERIRTFQRFDTVDVVRARGLLEDSFGQRLDDDYFTNKVPSQIYLADSYRAIAVLTREPVEANGATIDIPYLDKFAVTQEAQGEGIGGSIWHRMSREHPKLFWRSRATNPINSWYAAKATGMFKSERWTVFWCGVTSFTEIQACVERALAMKASLHAADA